MAEKTMFALSKMTATLAHFNARAELHGEERKPAADLKLTITGPNRLLELIDPALREVLYKPAPAKDADQLFDAEPELALLRFPYPGTVHWSRQEVGRDVEIEWGMDDSSAIRLALCTIDKFAVDPQEGGSVSITFRVRCYPTAEDAEKLFELQTREVTISVREAAQGDLFAASSQGATA